MCRNSCIRKLSCNSNLAYGLKIRFFKKLSKKLCNGNIMAARITLSSNLMAGSPLLQSSTVTSVITNKNSKNMRKGKNTESSIAHFGRFILPTKKRSQTKQISLFQYLNIEWYCADLFFLPQYGQLLVLLVLL